MSDIAALLGRVKAATKPDREIDGLIAKHFHEMPDDAVFEAENVYGQTTNQWFTGGYGAYVDHNPEEYTASVDAALALVERMLPGWGAQMSTGSMFADGRAFVTLYSTEARRDYYHEGDGATLPLAILAALLTALQSQEPGDASSLLNEVEEVLRTAATLVPASRLTALQTEVERLRVEGEAAKVFGGGFYAENVTEETREFYRSAAQEALRTSAGGKL